MNIIFLSGLYPPRTKGGGELSSHLLARALVRRGHDVRVLTEGISREETVVDGVSVTRLPVRLTAKPLAERRHFRRVAQLLGKEIQRIVASSPADWVVHAHDYKSALALADIPVSHKVVTHRDYAVIAGDTNNLLRDGTVPVQQTWSTSWRSHRVHEAKWWRRPFRFWQYAYNAAYRREAFARYQHQVFISKAQQREIAQQFDLSGVTTQVIYNPAPDNYVAEPTSAGGGQGTVLYVGRVEQYKGVGLLLRAWREIVRTAPAAHLKIVGEGAQKSDYERLVERWGLGYTVTFAGWLPWNRLRPVYDEASVVVAPHLWVEPFGRTVIEAMARGKIVVAANSGGPAEIVQHGVTGFLFERGSADGLATSIEAALVLPSLRRRELQQAARQWVRVNLRPDTIAEEYERFYQRLLEA